MRLLPPVLSTSGPVLRPNWTRKEFLNFLNESLRETRAVESEFDRTAASALAAAGSSPASSAERHSRNEASDQRLVPRLVAFLRRRGGGILGGILSGILCGIVSSGSMGMDTNRRKEREEGYSWGMWGSDSIFSSVMDRRGSFFEKKGKIFFPN